MRRPELITIERACDGAAPVIELTNGVRITLHPASDATRDRPKRA